MVKSKNIKRVVALILVIIWAVGFVYGSVYAESPKPTSDEDMVKIAEEQAETSIGRISKLVASIFQKIGIFVIFIGGIQVAWAMSSDNPEMKGQAFKLIAAGILVTVMATAYPYLAGK